MARLFWADFPCDTRVLSWSDLSLAAFSNTMARLYRFCRGPPRPGELGMYSGRSGRIQGICGHLGCPQSRGCWILLFSDAKSFGRGPRSFAFLEPDGRPGG